LKKKRLVNWENIPEDWPYKSVYSQEFQKKQTEYIKDGVALIKPYLKNYVVPASLFSDHYIRHGGLTDIKIKVMDKSNNVLLNSERIILVPNASLWVNTNSDWSVWNTGEQIPCTEYFFNNVNQETMKIIDGGNIQISLDSAFLQYGAPKNFIEHSDRSWLKSLPEIKLDTAKLIFGQDSDIDVLDLAAKRFAVSKIQQSMVTVKAGTFLMGTETASGPRTALISSPTHRVTLDSFQIMSIEVTQSIYQAVMGENPVRVAKNKGDDLPVNEVSWEKAIKFCNLLSEAAGLEPCYDGEANDIIYNSSANGYRLPTEAEWEFAARGGTHGNSFLYSGSENIDDVAWYKDNSGNALHKGAQKKPNALGLYDMTGNVDEWCFDPENYYPAEPSINPVLEKSGIGRNRIFRGGDFATRKDSCTVTKRSSDIYSSKAAGIRIVRSLQ
ncbi:MAG: SUMF1/EgtB/PvdO family nonheme iron enzyme, partial [Treponema sp.]|nr:SUMF1/EgtB/PvdO family nonheme iron enzyme [Treponema sp.]